MKKFKILLLVFAVLITTAFSGGCSKSCTEALNTDKETLVVANWKGYGSDSPYAVETFEKENNCKVVHQYFTSNDDLINMMEQGGKGKIDVMLPNIAYMHRIVRDELAEPLDTSKLTNFYDTIEMLRTHDDLYGFKHSVYGVPWVWGTTSIWYDTTKIKTPPTSISILWDKKYKGQVAFSDDYTIAILTAAMYLKEDPYNPDLDAVKEALIELKNNSKVLWSSYDSFSKAFMSGSVVTGNVWSGVATQMKADGANIDYVYPSEGTILWQDVWCIAKDAPHKELAYKWLNWMTSERFLKKFCSDLDAQPPLPANKKVLDSFSIENKKLFWIYPKLPDNIIMQRSVPDEESEKWMEIWNEVKAS
jgi:spermidine/putrescine transport system substrate-binding protein